MIQRFLPVVQEDRPTHVLGLLDLGRSIVFTGEELSVRRSTPAGTALVNVRRVDLADGKFRMDAVFSREDIRLKQHTGQGFVPVFDVSPSMDWTSGSGLANNLRAVDGLLLSGLSDPSKFGPGRAPRAVGTVAITGTFLVNNQVQVPGTANLWDGQVDERTYQWEFNHLSEWVSIPGATASTFVPPVAGFYRCQLHASNAFGLSEPFFTSAVNIAA